MHIRGLERLSPVELEEHLRAGSRFVYYEYCISLVFITLRRPTAVCLLKKDELGIMRGIPYTVISLLLGWWGLPWGVIYTPLTIITNLSGGRDITDEMRLWLQQAGALPRA